MAHILVYDLGTTALKTVLFDEKGRVVANASAAYPTRETADGGFEQNPAQWLDAVCSSTRELVAKSRISPFDIPAISICGHMMGVVALDGSGRPLRPAILHSDMRSRPQVKAVAERISPSRVHQIGGNPLDVHYPWTKIAWLRDNESTVYNKASVFCQSKDYLGAWLTGEAASTDWSDASLYGCFDFHRMTWSDELIEAGQIDKAKLPRIIDSSSLAGRLNADAARSMGLPSGIPVVKGFGDGASAALGSGAWGEGTVYNYIGSTSWVACATAKPVIDSEGRLFTLAITEDRFNSIGTVQCAGAAWDWAVSRFCQCRFDEAEAAASASPAGANGLVFLPYLSGERAPVWNEKARGVWFGLSSSHSAGDMLRSVIEGVCLALSSNLSEVRRCSGVDPAALLCIGGVMRSDLWRRILSASYGIPIVIPSGSAEATARGAFLAAARQLEMISSYDEAAGTKQAAQKIDPSSKDTAVYAEMLPLFVELYQKLEDSFDHLDRVKRLRLGIGEGGNAPL